MASTAAEETLASLSVEQLMKEVQRRLECQTKPERRIIFIGKKTIVHDHREIEQEDTMRANK